jgi:hypothetical protein
MFGQYLRRSLHTHLPMGKQQIYVFGPSLTLQTRASRMWFARLRRAFLLCI